MWLAQNHLIGFPAIPRKQSGAPQVSQECSHRQGSRQPHNSGSYGTLRRLAEICAYSPRQFGPDWAPHWATLVLRGWSQAEIVERLEKADTDEAFQRKMELLRGEG
jgi:hypothetical protein